MRSVVKQLSDACRHNQRPADEMAPNIIENVREAARSLEASLSPDAERDHLDRALRILIDAAGQLSGVIWQPRVVGETAYQLCNLHDCSCYKRRPSKLYRRKLKGER